MRKTLANFLRKSAWFLLKWGAIAVGLLLVIHFVKQEFFSKPADQVVKEELVEATGTHLKRSMESVKSAVSRGETAALAKLPTALQKYHESVEFIKSAGQATEAPSPSEKNIAATASKLPTPPEPVITDLGDDTWKVLVPANKEVFTGIKISQGQTIQVISVSGTVKTHPRDIFTNPPQGALPVSEIQTRPEEFVLQTAYVGALIARLTPSSPYFDIGGRNGKNFLSTEDGEIILTFNGRRGQTIYGSGSFEVTFQISN